MLNKNMILIFCFLLLACGSLPSQQGTHAKQADWIAVIASGVMSPHIDQKSNATWIASSEDFKNVLSGFEKLQMSDKKMPLPNIDFSKFGVIFVAMGQKPTGGYSLSFDASLSSQAGNKATIGIRFNRPDQGAVLTQAITSPYIMLKLSKECCSKVIIIDEEKEILFEIKLE
jgi:hypothetical protein